MSYLIYNFERASRSSQRTNVGPYHLYFIVYNYIKCKPVALLKSLREKGDKRKITWQNL